MIDFNRGRWEGLDGMGDDALNELRKPAEATLRRGLVRYASELKLTLTGSRSGRVYTVGKRGRTHVAAAPGEPPAVLFGNLRNSVGFSEPVWDGPVVSGEVGVGLGTKPKGGIQEPEKTYARLQEFGGIVRGVRHYPHPYMEPTALRMEPILDQMFAEFR